MGIIAKVVAVPLLFAACGGRSVPATPTPLSRNVTFTVFLDENRNGTLEPAERIRIPGAGISFGAASGKSLVTSGEVILSVLQSAQVLSVTAASLPPYHRAPESQAVTPPLDRGLNVPVVLPLGPDATPGVFLAFGDSITNGQVGVGDGQGYTGQLERMLDSYFGFARVINDGIDSSSSERGDSRISTSLAAIRPAFTLILYGTNDWSDPRCGQPPCFTIDSLRSIVRKVKGQGGFPFLGTFLMLNVGNDFRASPQRNAWVIAQNELIRQMAVEEDVVLVDLYAALERSPLPYSELFADYIHPSAAGYRVMAEAWFDAITKRL